MKKKLILSVAAGLLLILTFYALYDATRTPENIPDDLAGRIRQTDYVDISYNIFSSHIMVSENQQVINELADCFAGLTFTSTEESIDPGTALMLYFHKEDEQDAVIKIWVDRNGVFYFDDDAQSYYHVESGDFDFEQVYTIYRSKSDR